MKILIIQDFLRSGGTERQSVLLANAFVAAGHATTLLTFRPAGALSATVALNVARRTLQPRDLGLDWFAPGLRRSAQRAAPDVVLCMGRMANCYAGRLQEKLPGVAVIGTMRTGKPLPRLFRRSLHTVRHVIANSHAARDTLIRDHSVGGDKISVIHNSLVFPAEVVQAAGGAASCDGLRAAQGARPATLVLLCVAMFRPEKNQRELVEIAAGLPPELEWQLWLAGEGPALPACQQLVEARALNARVKFLGFQPDPSALYRSADLAVHASASEALSNFLIEAQAHGVPGIAYQAQGIEECFIPNRTGWVIARDDRAAFRSALVAHQARPPAARAQIAVTSRRYARETFDPERQVVAYLNLFARLTA